MRGGDVVLVQFPFTDLAEAKFRPALVLGKLPGSYEDWLICMISSQVRQYTPSFDELIKVGDSDFAGSGLKGPSVVRVGRLLVVEARLMPGTIGAISMERLQRIRRQLTSWLLQA